ncbi:MAG: hypothetical protein QOF89_204 [Acidobacteriota bacterium]|jgi:hypothetical protein|nr:hypothetical protein [Acidobacteriota bacterium]
MPRSLRLETHRRGFPSSIGSCAKSLVRLNEVATGAIVVAGDMQPLPSPTVGIRRAAAQSPPLNTCTNRCRSSSSTAAMHARRRSSPAASPASLSLVELPVSVFVGRPEELAEGASTSALGSTPNPHQALHPNPENTLPCRRDTPPARAPSYLPRFLTPIPRISTLYGSIHTPFSILNVYNRPCRSTFPASIHVQTKYLCMAFLFCHFFWAGECIAHPVTTTLDRLLHVSSQKLCIEAAVLHFFL